LNSRFIGSPRRIGPYLALFRSGYEYHRLAISLYYGRFLSKLRSGEERPGMTTNGVVGKTFFLLALLAAGFSRDGFEPI
jgi:hypothetical protein